jgi:hypothetical protein
MWRGAMEFRWSSCWQLLHRPFALVMAAADGIFPLASVDLVLDDFQKNRPIDADSP